jgi:dTDP-4-amino-4,6-dideoxygalactose transaminase
MQQDRWPPLDGVQDLRRQRATGGAVIKVLIPDMPTADELLPYLREIDASRVYVNQGPLVRRLEDQLSALVKNPCAVVANGTVSMELALRAMNLPRGSEVLVPAVTYVASGQAIVNAGLAPVICDVDPQSWQLTPEIAGAALPHFPKARAVMPVAAFGLPVPIEPWEKFTYETNLPVLIDAAGAIYGQQSSTIPEIVVSYSLHATKAIGAGEGGAIATCDLTLLERIEQLATFGAGGTNAKMSEYHAAVALASMARVRPDWRAPLIRAYVENLPEHEFQFGSHPQQTLFPVLLSDAHTAATSLSRSGIETKQWYRPFLDERTEFFNFQKFGPQPVTPMLRQRMLGLPWHAFLTESDVARVCAVLQEALA